MKNIYIKKLIAVIAIVMCLTVVFCGCKSMSDGNYTSDSAMGEFGTAGTDEKVLEDLTDADARKLIRTVDINAETKSFDAFLTSFEKAVSDNGGYIQSQSISNSRYDDMRSGNITARIPSDKLDGFVGAVSETATVISRSSELQDVTDQYIDVESRIKALEVEQQALMSMLEKAAAIDDIMSIQGRLSEVRGELESYKARQKAYDNQVAYSTVKIYVEEVERESEADPGFWQEAGNALSDSFKGVVVGLRGFALFLIGALPYLMLMGVIAVAVVVIVKSSIASARKKRARKAQDKNEAEK